MDVHSSRQDDQQVNEAANAPPNENDQEPGALADSQHAATEVSNSLGGTVKGVVDTAGNTVHAVGSGVYGTVSGLGKGLGNAAAYGGSAVGKSFGYGNQQTGQSANVKAASSGEEATKSEDGAKKPGEHSEKEKWRLEREELERAQTKFEEHEGIRMESKRD